MTSYQSGAAADVTVTGMSDSLNQELDRRRQHWQRDVERMQHDFFKV